MGLLGVFLGGCGGGGSASPGSVASSSRSPSAQGDPSSGAKWLIPPRPIPGIRQRFVGSGVRGAMLLWDENAPPPRRAVVFLHGWQAKPPWVYGDWLRHLVGEGNAIVYPVGEDRETKPAAILANTLAGIAVGLRAANADADVVAIGHVTGGAIAFDYAATAEGRGLPAPRGVFAVYPARHPPSGEIPSADLSRISPSTLLEVVGGPGDPIPGGNAQARALLAAATRVPAERRSFLRAPYQRSPGPIPLSAAPRPSFWGPADRLIARARANASSGGSER